MKNRSFLNPYQKEYGSVVNASTDLSLNILVSYIYPDVNTRERIVKILEDICLDKETIYFRQELVKEFLVNKSLYHLIQTEIKNIEKCYSQYNATKAQRSKIKVKNEITITDSQMQMRDYGFCLKNLIGIIGRLVNILFENKVTSKGLIDLRNVLQRRNNSEGFLLLREFLEELEESGGSYSFVARISDTLTFEDIKYYFPEKKEDKEKFRLFKKTKESGKLELDNGLKEDNRRAILECYNKIAPKMEIIFETLFSELEFLPREFLFFEFAYALYDLLSEKADDFCFPEIDDKIKYICAQDPYLIARYQKEEYEEKIFGNDLSLFSNESALVCGGNNTGKTVFLRTIGIYQIFAQSGLFLPCKEAKTMIFNKIVTIFSGEEKDTNTGGRFEKEVIDIKDIIESVDSKSLVIINEIFQSTFARDGENALFDILEYFTCINVKWITVTHLLGLKNKINDFTGKVKGFATTGKENNYQIVERN